MNTMKTIVDFLNKTEPKYIHFIARFMEAEVLLFRCERYIVRILGLSVFMVF